MAKIRAHRFGSEAAMVTCSRRGIARHCVSASGPVVPVGASDDGEDGPEVKDSERNGWFCWNGHCKSILANFRWGLAAIALLTRF